MSITSEHHADSRPSRRNALLALLLLVPAPTLGVTAAMMWEPTRGTMVGQAAYLAAKLWILALPLTWHVFVDRRPIVVSRPSGAAAGVGAAWGLAIAAAIAAGYWFVGQHAIDLPVLREAAAKNALDDPARYLALAITLTLGNSLLEEYVWRWFVYRQCEAIMPARIAVIASALMFTLHHFVALKAQMGWMPTLLACAGILIGGCIWSGLFRRFRSIWPGYVSHIFADVAVFGVGWILLYQ